MVNNPYDCVADATYRLLVNTEHTAPSTCAAGTSCITIAVVDGHISVQDSKLDTQERRARTQVYTAAEVAAFVRDVKAGRYDDLF